MKVSRGDYKSGRQVQVEIVHPKAHGYLVYDSELNETGFLCTRLVHNCEDKVTATFILFDQGEALYSLTENDQSKEFEHNLSKEIAAYRERNYSEVVRMLDGRISVDLKSVPIAHFLLASSLYAINQHKEAEQHFTAVTQLSISALGEHCRRILRSLEIIQQTNVGEDTGFIGVTLRNGVVKKVFRDSPAWSAGIQQGDEICTIDGQNCDDMSDVEMCKTIMGEENTSVALTVSREGIQHHFDVVRMPVDKSRAFWNWHKEIAG